MKISELVTQLEALWAEHGDVDVEYINRCCCYGNWEEEPDPRYSNDPYERIIL